MTDDNASTGQAAVIAFLADPATHGGMGVERIETHASLIFLAGDRAFKVKRAVRYPYLDFSTLEKRRRACIAETKINRRTAPAMYLGIAPVLRASDGSLRLGPLQSAPDETATLATAEAETVVEWLVVMRRFDQNTLFDRLGRDGALTDTLMRRLAETVAAFHDRAEARADISGADAIRAVIEGNIDEMAAWPTTFAPEKLDRLATRSREAAKALSPLLDQRARDGWVRLCHGDLHLRNICLIDGEPTLFDAIEFNEAIAVTDILYDLAFLLMDLGYRGLHRLANIVLNRYLEAVWARDPAAATPPHRDLPPCPCSLPRALPCAPRCRQPPPTRWMARRPPPPAAKRRAISTSRLIFLNPPRLGWSPLPGCPAPARQPLPGLLPPISRPRPARSCCAATSPASSLQASPKTPPCPRPPTARRCRIGSMPPCFRARGCC